MHSRPRGEGLKTGIEAPIHRLLTPLEHFVHVEASSGIVLLAATALALALANSPWSESFLAFWETPVGFQFGAHQLTHDLQHWINDGLMVIFFFVIGLEVKRELVAGELRDLRKAVLPLAAAVGGMIAPAAIYLAFQAGQAGARGWGIPMATDIAFVVGCMAVLGSRVPRGLRIMLLTLAIADDIGAILVIAVGYTAGIQWAWLAAGAVGIAAVYVFARLGVRSFLVYWLLGAAIWFAFLESGVHATIAGVILGLMTPARSYLGSQRFAEMLDTVHELIHGEGDDAEIGTREVTQFRRATRELVPPGQFLEHKLHPWVGFCIVPLFAFANAGVPVRPDDLLSPVAIAVAAGLLVGKPVGIVLFAWLAVVTGLGRLPDGVNWRLVFAGGCLSGIGFTMALFIASLALQDHLLETAKIGVLAGSLLSAAAGMTMFYLHPRPKTLAANEPVG